MEKLVHRLNKIIEKAKARYQYIIAAGLIAITVYVVYGHDLLDLMNEAIQSETFNHVLLIPFFAGFLIYIKRDTLKAALNLDSQSKKASAKYVDPLIGSCLCLTAFLLYWYGSKTFYPLEYHILSLPIFLLGFTLILFNLKATLTLGLPILFLLFLVPFPNQFLYIVGGTMANFNTQASYSILKAGNLPVALSPVNGPPTIILNTTIRDTALNVTRVQSTPFTVDLPCSGIYSLIAFAAFAVFLGLIATASIISKIAIAAIGFLAFEVLNVIRISATVSIAYWFGQEAAMVLFHSVAGLMLIFIGMLLTLFVGQKFLKIQILPPRTNTECPDCNTSTEALQDFCTGCGKAFNRFKPAISRRFWTILLITLLATSIIAVSINAPTFAIANGPSGSVSEMQWENATRVFPKISNYELEFWGRDTYYEQIAHQDASLMYLYTNSSRPEILVDVGIADSMSNLHNWEVCLISWQTAQGKYPLVPVLDQRDLQLLENSSLIAQYLVFTRPPPYNYTQVTLYWYEKVNFSTGTTVVQKYVRISLIIATHNSTNYRQYEDELLPVAQAIASYWEPLKTQSLVSLGIPAQQGLLVALIAFVTFTKTAQYSNDWRKKNNNLRIFNMTATVEEKTLLRTIQNLHQKERKIPTRTIKEELERDSGRKWEIHDLLSALNNLEEYGFIKKDIRSIANEPKLVWKI